ncbi:MAG: four helix bundle protein [Myxococcales bacterium]|nr:four helix bundle protein [Myxococcales bacterium]
MTEQSRPTFSFETLDVYERAIEFVAQATEIATRMPPGHAPLADQLRRASVSVVLNIAVGSGRVRKLDADRHRAIARGSAMECAAILDVCRVLMLVDAIRLDEARTLLVRVVQMLCRMCG